MRRVLIFLMVVLAVFGFSKYTFYLVSHGGPADPFWAVVMKGLKDAGEKYGVETVYLGPEKYSLKEFIDLVNSTIARKPDGLIVTITNPVALDEPLRKAIKMGIPVVAINVPDTRPPEEAIPYLVYVGMDEYLAGVYAARRMLQEFTPKRAVIAIHEPGHAGLEARAKGIMDVLSEKNIPVEKLDITTDPTKALSIMKSYLMKHPDTDAIFTLGPLGAHPAIQLVEEEGLKGKVKIGAIDLTTKIIEAIKDGTVLFTIDQQQYLQGYLPVVFLYLYKEYGLIPHEKVLTGPSIVDKSNVDVVEKTVREGYR
ncbi:MULTISPECIES: sugar ABC transporter substrate-binding protein [unclassified Thermotoga]|uniref:sugar ABC transporter substrate-binding protein n=1 Tax=unclassified Thermotoga TaxID=2631113 RepID=UPI0005412B9A|nr:MULTISPECIES: sugar ABC transporter substrate-binding protein [unclassified Thermotoga]AIY87849.1 Sugar binding protein of ABC transporter [Thermotoga sp. Cell2]KHC91727.1 Sugar binding protein of ABC transporter [Thermotoga sp. TBGT1765]KHC93759.1 Sugar binding protein of ABC transporter [Thermotoga sp. TBGT1766]KHC96198.1 Sugar binding protein of ABC transporter [Thermotoga sp. Xyl54]